MTTQNEMPRELLSGNRSNMPLMTLTRAHLYPDGDILGFRLPPFQRPAVWTQGQQIRFMESAWLGFSLGEVVITDAQQQEGLDRLIIDGQQRMMALAAYLDDAFPVFGLRYSELSERDVRRLRMSITIGIVWLKHDLSMERLEELYTRMNYGGTAHAPEHHPDYLPEAPK
jgi:Protein of unknown function DUF262